MARGCPAIASNLPGIRELLEHSWLTSVGDSSDLARCIATIISDGEKLSHAVQHNPTVAATHRQSVIAKRRNDHYSELRECCMSSTNEVRARVHTMKPDEVEMTSVHGVEGPRSHAVGVGCDVR